MEAEPIKFYLIALCAGLAVGCTPSGQAEKAGKKKEKHYQAEWCAGKGQTEQVLPDRTRVDCLTDSHAIEFDWGKKWHEGIGQSLYYAVQTEKRAGVVLILTGRKQYKYWIRLNSTIDYHRLPIDTWLIEDY
jgi:hypothetical protein